MRNRAGALGPQGINLAVESLTAALRRVRGEVAAPHAALRAQALQLRNLHATLDLLRHLLHRLKLVAKLRVRARPAAALRGDPAVARTARDLPPWPADAPHRATRPAPGERDARTPARRRRSWRRRRRTAPARPARSTWRRPRGCSATWPTSAPRPTWAAWRRRPPTTSCCAPPTSKSARRRRCGRPVSSSCCCRQRCMFPG